jgi:hypothetical protein
LAGAGDERQRFRHGAPRSLDHLQIFGLVEADALAG